MGFFSNSYSDGGSQQPAIRLYLFCATLHAVNRATNEAMYEVAAYTIWANADDDGANSARTFVEGHAEKDLYNVFPTDTFDYQFYILVRPSDSMIKDTAATL